MAINVSGILKSPQGSAIQNAEIIFEQTRTSTEVLAGTKFSIITNQTGNYSSSLGVGTYTFKVRFQDETQYRTVASNVIVTQSMDNYSLNQIIQVQSQLQDVDYDLLQDVIQARNQAAESAQVAQISQSTATTKASEASSSAQAALASKNAAQTSEANALASKNDAQSSQTSAAISQIAAANSQTAAANSQTTATTKASEASSSAQAALTSKNAAQTSETNALASKNAAQTSQTTAANSQTGAATSQTTATTKATEASASQTQAQQSQSAAQDSAQQADTSASDAQSSQTSASASQTTATTKATESSNSAQAALASKNAAQTSETNALASKNQAQSSQTNAASSQTAAAGSQTTASTKASQAASSQTQAQQSQSDAGAAASQADNSAQQAQQSQTSASTSQATATTKASEASSSAQAALASKNAAQTSETNALSSKNAAQTSQTNAAGSQTAASTSQTTASTKAGEASTSQTTAAASQTTATTKAGEASTSQTNAATSQATATTKAGEASTSQTNAAASQATATTKATEATNSATLAQKWAANPENSVVSGGLYSALHYAAKAAQSAQTATGQLVWRGGWSAQAGTAPPTPTGTTQDFYRITQAGTILSVQYEVGDYIHWDNINSIWFKMDGTDSVTSVNGRTGAVVVTKTDVGLSAVNNWGASSQTNDASTTTYATTAGVKAAYDLAATKLAATANAVSATKLVTPRTINGTNFDGTANITTQNWGTSRNLTIGETSKAVNGSADTSWTLNEIGAAPAGFGLGVTQIQKVAQDQTEGGFWRDEALNLAGITMPYDGSPSQAFLAVNVLSNTLRFGKRTGATSVAITWYDVYSTNNKPTAADLSVVPDTRTINGKRLNANVTLVPQDLGTLTTSEIEALGRKSITINQPAGLVQGKYYPIVVTNYYNDQALYITTRSSGDSDPMNNCSFDGIVRQAGWSDKSSIVDGVFTAYSSSERAIHSIIGPSEQEGVYAIYVEAGQFPVVVRVQGSQTVQCTGANISYGTSTFVAQVDNPSTITGATNKLSILADFAKGSGRYRGGSLYYHEGYLPTPDTLGAVPQARTINSKPLTSNITLSAADVGAVAKTGDTMTGLLKSTVAGNAINLLGGNIRSNTAQVMSLDGSRYAFVTSISDVHLCQNSYWDGVSWKKYDNAAVSAHIVIRDGSARIQTSAAGATNPIQNSYDILHTGNITPAHVLPTNIWWTGKGIENLVNGCIAWRNYGNGHVIFDASGGKSPTGEAVNNTNPVYDWSVSYPTLMGWNGAATFGVRVDRAKTAEATINGLTEGGSHGTLTLSNWIRTTGDTGLFCASWGGGIHMQDTTWVRVYNGKRFFVSNTDSAAIYTAGGMTAEGNGSFNDVQVRSDERLKSNYQPITSALDKVGHLAGITYDKIGKTTREAGIIAQRLKEVLPEATGVVFDSMDADAIEYLTISNSGVNALLVEAIKELTDRVKYLESKIN